MASSSSASNSQFSPRWKYDVFLSFRGEDTRRTFTSHLYECLRVKGIYTFQDDKRLEHGTSIAEELLKAIEESQVVVIVFSTNYATSSWCLDELMKIMKCKIQYGQKVIPIFYDVDPSTVRYQKESFAEAFAKHELKCKGDVERIQKVHTWRTALTDVANLRGYDIRQGIESEHIQLIVDQISSNLCKSTSLSSLQGIVGMNTHLEKVKPLLEIEINDVRIVGIWGIGGVGKTTIARAIFETLSYQFEAACFLADIKENEQRHQLHSLQNTLLSKLLREKDDYVNNKYDGKCMISNRLCSKKVMIVLDDIDHEDHLDYLAGDLGWFGNGSRIVVTTRNKHLIRKKDALYEVTVLANPEAIQLFNQYAFKEEAPDECFEKLISEVVAHANGLPLALKVWGSLLHKTDLTKWRNVVDQIKKNSGSEIFKKLKISYDGLEPEEKEIFLDIACLFRGYRKEKVMQILNSCDFGAECGLDILIEKSLVFISESKSGDTIEMHDLIQDMGKYIVNLQEDLGKRSRLWLAKDFEKVMIDNKGIKAMEAIQILNCEKLCLSKKTMKTLKRLRILCIQNCNPRFEKRNYVMDGSIEYLTNTLRWFVWDYYPSKSLPANFEPKRLVHLELTSSSLHHLWTVTKELSCLRTLNLSRSSSLTQAPNFTGMLNLEYLDLSYCRSLEEVHDSLGNCNKLIRLDLEHCINLKRFPCVNVESLEYLSLKCCSSLENFPEILGRMKLEVETVMQCTGIRKLPLYIQYQTPSTTMNLTGLKNLVAFPDNICRLKGLVCLDVYNCSQLESLPEEIGYLENLESFDATNTLIAQPPSSIVCLNKLGFLSFAKINVQDAVHFVFPQVNEGLHSLQILNLDYCNLIDGGLPEDIGCLSSLKELHLRGNNFESLPRSITQLRSLSLLDLAECKTLNELPELPPNIHTLHADFHVALKSIHSLASKYKKLTSVGFSPLNYKVDDMFAESLCQCISAIDSLCQRVIYIQKYPLMRIPSWFPHQGMDGRSLFFNMPANWHVDFLGFVICCSGCFDELSIELLPLRNNASLSLWDIHPNPEKLSMTLASRCYFYNFFPKMKMYSILYSYHMLVYGIHLRQMEQDQMTMDILSFPPHLREIEELRSWDFNCCIRTRLMLRHCRG